MNLSSSDDWIRLEREVAERIRLLAAVCSTKFEGPKEFQKKICEDLIAPNVLRLLEFCNNVTLEDSSEE